MDLEKDLSVNRVLEYEVHFSSVNTLNCIRKAQTVALLGQWCHSLKVSMIVDKLIE